MIFFVSLLESHLNYIFPFFQTQAHTYSFAAEDACTGCFIQLLRSAREWGTSYKFHSCADVEIVAADAFTEECSGHGTVSGVRAYMGTSGRGGGLNYTPF